MKLKIFQLQTLFVCVKTYYLAALVVLLLGGYASAQRCGGSIDYVVRDEKGVVIEPEKATIKFDVTQYEGAKVWHNEDRNFTATYNSLPVFGMDTGCGVKKIEAELTYKGRTMRLKFLNPADEANIIVDSLPFQDGSFVIDFEGQWKLSEPLNKEGIIYKNKLYLSKQAAEHSIVAAEKWQRDK